MPLETWGSHVIFSVLMRKLGLPHDNVDYSSAKYVFFFHILMSDGLSMKEIILWELLLVQFGAATHLFTSLIILMLCHQEHFMLRVVVFEFVEDVSVLDLKTLLSQAKF